jgi:hypothetical protein
VTVVPGLIAQWEEMAEGRVHGPPSKPEWQPDVEAYLERCTAAIGEVNETGSGRLVSFEADVRRRWPPDSVARVHRLLTLRLSRAGRSRVRDMGWPAEVLQYWLDDLARILRAVAEAPDEDFAFSKYPFRCDLRVLALRRIPLGMYDLDVTGIPRLTLLKQGPRSLVRLLRSLHRCGGMYPFFSQHVAPHRRHLFDPVERRRSLELTARLVRARPEVRGLISTAWYNDPRVAEISPHLAYLREALEEVGGTRFRIGRSAQVVQDALTRSSRRRRLFEAGSYSPAAFLVIVARAGLLRVTGALSAHGGQG